MRSIFIINKKLSLLDDGITTIFLGLTLHRMINNLFDQNTKCIWKFEIFKADLVDSISRIMMFNVIIYFSTYLAKKVIYLSCLYIYIYILFDVLNTVTYYLENRVSK